MSDHPKTDAAMPLVMALINRDVMPLIKRVILKRVELYLREIEEQQRASTPKSAPEGGHIDRARFKKAPCYLCGYNGHGYYQAETHPCAAKYHAASSAESGADGEVCQHTWVTDGINPTRCSKCRRPATTISAESGEVDRG